MKNKFGNHQNSEHPAINHTLIANYYEQISILLTIFCLRKYYERTILGLVTTLKNLNRVNSQQ